MMDNSVRQTAIDPAEAQGLVNALHEFANGVSPVIDRVAQLGDAFWSDPFWRQIRPPRAELLRQVSDVAFALHNMVDAGLRQEAAEERTRVDAEQGSES
jgi:hypothetical protein